MQRSPLFILAVLLCVSFLYSSFIFSEYSATPETNQVSITWKTNTEEGIARFSIMRSPDDEHFAQIGTIESRGEASEYKYIDENVFFKSGETFFYKLRALGGDNSVVEETQSLIVNPNISGIFRTWGAIKAMFR